MTDDAASWSPLLGWHDSAELDETRRYNPDWLAAALDELGHRVDKR